MSTPSTTNRTHAASQVAKTAKQLRLEEEVVARQQAAAEAARQRAEEAKRLADLRAKGMAVPSAQEEEDDDDDKEEEGQYMLHCMGIGAAVMKL